MSVTKLNGYRLQKMIIAGANALIANKQTVDAMNVFPVPDGDTGTNMSLTVLAAAKEAEKGDALRVDAVVKRAASGALRGARGNSGVITSQLFRGFSKGLEGLEEAGVKELAVAMEQGVKTAYKAVMKPKEGTILTVARACAEAAEYVCQETDDIELFLKKVLEHAHKVLNQTPDMLPVLKEAGVVDAGGRGLLYILEGALEHIHTEEEIALAEPTQETQQTYAALASVENQSITFGYCTEFFINVKQADDAVIQQLKSYLGTIGDSVVCVSDEEIIKIHVHTDHPGLALEKALTIGSLSGLKIDNMREQHNNMIDFAAPVGVAQPKAVKTAEKQNTPKKEIGFVAISAGDGLTAIFHNLGVDEVLEGGQTMNPSTEDILNAVAKVNADNVFILPNNKNIILAAEQAAALSEDKKLYVIPTKSVPQGITAMFCHETDTTPEALADAMNEAITTVTTASVTFAVRETTIGEKEIHEGDILGMLEGDIAVVGEDMAQTTKDLLAKAITEDSEMIGVYYGADVSEQDAADMVAYIEENYPDCEVELQSGGQPLYYYIISVE